MACLIKARRYRLGRYLIRQGFRWRHKILVIYHQHPRLYNRVGASVAGVVVIGLLALGVLAFIAPSYQLTTADSQLIGPADTSLMKTGKFAYNSKAKAYYLNKSDLNSSANSFSSDAVTVGNNSSNASYALKLPTALSHGVTVRDNTSGLSFSLIPQFSTTAGKNLSSHIVYPLTNTSGAEDIYTVKQNGLQEDVVLNQPTSSLKLTYKLSLPSYLTARSLSDGAIGIYSADPALFGNITYGDSKDQLAVAKARVNSQKNYLVFALLPPIIKDGSTISSTNPTNPPGTKTSLTLKGNTITLVASSLGRLPKTAYPLDIDPSILVASANSFGATGNNEGDINIGTSSVNEAGLDGGVIGSWTSTTAFSSSGSTMPARYGFGAVAYDGYLYVFGGQAAASGGDCTSTGGYCNGVFYDSISSTGTLGISWTQDTTATFPSTMPARAGFAAAAYNGYLYLMGGSIGISSGDCMASGDYCNGTFYAPINANGTIGAWMSTTAFPSGMPARRALAPALASNGYLYLLGGLSNTSGGDCTFGGGAGYFCNGTFYAPINANGTIGAWTQDTTATFPSNMPARVSFADTVYDNYIYVMGGLGYTSTGDCATGGTLCNGTFYAPINANGTIGAWTSTTAFPSGMPARDNFGSVAYNGYLYVFDGMGNAASGDCTAASDLCNGTFYAPINANGTIGAWTATTTFASGMPARWDGSAVAYNGYLYVMGGQAGASGGDCTATSNFCNGVFLASIQPAGYLGSVSAASSLPSAAVNNAAAAFNGYIYNFGGWGGSSAVATVSYAQVSSSGALVTQSSCPGGWTLGGAGATAWCYNNSSLPIGLQNESAVADNGYLYVIGGQNSSGNDSAAVYYAPINSNGSPGSWTATSSLPSVTYQTGVTVYNGYIYVSGGVSGGYLSEDVAYAAIGSSGALTVQSSCPTNWTLGGAGSTAWCYDSYSLPAYVYQDVSVASNGYVYVLGGSVVSNDTETVEYAATSSTGALTAPSTCPSGWTLGGDNNIWCYNSSSLPFDVASSVTLAYNGYIYDVGGDTDSGNTATIEYAPINNDGSVGSWVATTSLSASTGNGAGVVYDGYIYVMGGSPGNGIVATVMYLPVNNGGVGTVVTWSQDTTATFPSNMPARYGLATVAYNGYIYAMGGKSSTSNGDCTATGDFCNGVFYAPITSNGTVGAWTQDTTATFPSTMPARFTFTAVVYNGYIYAMGGQNNSGGGDCTSGTNPYFCNGTFFAPINSNGTVGAWTQDTTATFPSNMPARQGLSAVAYNSYLYVMAGQSLTSSGDCTATGDYCNGVWYAPINSNGTVGAWTQDTTATFPSNMPARYGFSAVAYNSYLYVMGGISGTSSGDCTASSNVCNGVWYTPINSNGTVGAWTATTNFTTTSMPAREYATAVAYNGYLYVMGGYATTSRGDCSVICNGVFYAPINSNGTVGAWTATTSFTATTMPARWVFSTVAYNGYLYVMGGAGGTSSGDCTAASSMCNGVFSTGLQSIPRAGYYSDLVNLSGNTGWNTTTSMSTAVYAAGSVAYNGYLYSFGGQTASSNTNIVEYAPIKSNGTIGSWTSTTMPVALQGFGYAEYNGYLYVMGGMNTSGTTVGVTYYAPINSNGSLGTWNTTTALPAVNDTFSAVAYNGYMYIFGGESSNNANNYNEADSIVINANGTLGSSWSAANSGFSSDISYESAVAYNGYVYILGGDYGGSYVNTVRYASINSGGTLGSWNTTSSFSTGRRSLGAVAVNGYLYVAGGYGSALLNDVQVALINSNGTLGAWIANTSFNTPRIFPGLVAYGGYLYVLGGCSILWSGVQGDVQYYPLPGTGDVTPTEIVTSGTNTGNPGIGGLSGPGGITVQYAQASNNCPAFSSSQTINTGATDQLGVLYVFSYSPYNSCGVATDLGSYVWLRFELDDSQTATFPDVNGNHTSITNFATYYHAATTNRLRGGATFANGSLQSLDTIQNMPHQLAAQVPLGVAVSPNTGQAGTVVNISATSGLSDLVAIKLGNTSIASGQFGSTSDTSAWFVVPSGIAAGTYDVTAENNIGWSATSGADQFTTYVPLNVSVSPGSAQVGTTVYISASSGLTNLAGIMLGGTSIASGQFGSTSDTSAWFVVPSGIGTGTNNVTAENSIGWSAASSANQFTASGPTLGSESPSLVSEGGTISLGGGGFGQYGDSLTVHVTATGYGTNSGSSTASYSWNSLTNLNAVIGGSGISGQMAITVSTAEGTSGAIDINVVDNATWGNQPGFNAWYYWQGANGNEVATPLMTVPVNMYVTSVSFYAGSYGGSPTVTWVIWNSSGNNIYNGSAWTPSGGSGSINGQSWQSQSTGFYLQAGQQIRIGWWWSGSTNKMVWSTVANGCNPSGLSTNSYQGSPGSLAGATANDSCSVGGRLTY